MTQYALITSKVVSDPTVKKFKIDQLLVNDNDGVRFLFDLGFSYSYPGGDPRPAPTDPINGQTVYDVAGKNNGSVVVGSGGAPDYAGGGFDYAQCVDRGSYLQFPNAAIADIYNNTGGNQYFLACLYLRLPTAANWVTLSNRQGTIWSGRSSASLVTEADLITMALQITSGGVKNIAMLRQKTAPSGTFDTLTLIPGASDYGGLAQLAMWRNAGGTGARLKTVNGTVLTTAAANAANTADFSAKGPKIGVPAPDWTASLTDLTGVKQYRIYRGFLENLVRSGRVPTDVLDADWTRVQQRIADSAVNNGGVSQIFN